MPLSSIMSGQLVCSRVRSLRSCPDWSLQVIFRCDLLPWAGLMGVHMLLERQISFGRGLAVGALAAVSSLAVTVLVDSVFWGRWLWPEGEVLWFNTAENR